MTDLAFSSPRSRLAAVIAEARRRGRRRRFALASIGLLALVAGGGIWAGLSLTGGGGAVPVHAPPGFHAVQAQGPVAHQILRTWIFPQPVSVDLATGKTQPVRTTTEVWYDSRGRVSRAVLRSDGRLQTDQVQACPEGAGSCAPEFSLKSYWPLDASRYTLEPGVGSFHGRPVIWIAERQRAGFAAYPGDGERIGLDPRTHEPVASRGLFEGKIISEAKVLERGPDIPAGDYAFVVPNSAQPLKVAPTADFSANGSDPFALRARRALGRTPLWLGERFHGNRLRAVMIGTTALETPAGTRLYPAPFVVYDYGNVWIQEFGSRGPWNQVQGPAPGRVTLQKSVGYSIGSTPNSVKVEITGRRALLTRERVFVIASTPDRGQYVLDRAGALRLAHALRPVPLP
jgi:hypothetical protein